jgi:hypothetical protein
MFSFLKLLTFLPVQSSHKNTKLEENNEIISNLKFIGKIKAGEQINIDTLSICSRNLFSGFYRSIYGESRDKTFHFFSLTIKRAFEKIQAYMNSDRISDKMLCKNLIQNLYLSIEGLNNLKETYKDDRGFLCDLETLIENIQLRLEELKLSNQSYFENISIKDKEDPKVQNTDVNLIKKQDNNKK